jgi:O-antigen/teichoic acid export membrane protein
VNERTDGPERRTRLGSALVYFSGNVAAAAIGLLAVVLFTRLLEPAAYGTFVVGQSTALILLAVFFAWLRISVLRLQSAGDHVDFRLTALRGLGGSVLIALLAYPLLQWMFGAVIAAGALFVACCTALFELNQEILRSRLQASRYAAASLVRSTASLGLGLAAVTAGLGGLGLLLSSGSACVLAAALIAPWSWHAPRAPFDRGRLSDLARFGMPAALSLLVFTVSASLDRLVLAHFWGTAASGSYGAAADLARQAITLPAASVASALFPEAMRLFETAGRSEVTRYLRGSVVVLVAAVLPAAVGLGLTSDLIAAAVLGPSFRAAAATLIPVIAAGFFFSAMSNQYVHVSFHLTKQPRLLFLHGLVILLANGALMLALVPSHGAIGAAVAFASAEAVGLVAGLLLARTGLGLPLPLGQLARVGLALAAMAAAVTGLRGHGGAGTWGPLLLAVSGGGLAYAAVLVALDVLGLRSELLRIAERLRPRKAAPAPD